ncbi:FxsB family radical SAM/SPASM domain protein [Sphaerisporangium flaviroseum]|uniref:FxsB family radical SAM/SPASM domain protein n=1 Tax=Sphaerisporangium flaviroseum TaxID=509199 RepID=A0ABP7HPB0_9ACTN
MLESGWRPSAFRQFILKINSRCDLSCRYCYIYEMADQSWRSQPRHMAPAIVDHAARRIAAHARLHDLGEIEVILHGGEPLLVGPDLLSYTVKAVRGAADTGTRVHVALQTNAVRMDEAYLRVLDGLGVRVGVSLDGYAEAHDRHRRFANGKGSHTAVASSLRRLAAGPFHHLFSGILCTIDVRNDPVRTYEALIEFDPPAVDFLLPHGNWVTPPPFRDPESTETPYADWLIPIFDRWYGSPREETEVRMFNEIMRLLMGRPSRTEAVGLSPARMVVIETDGSYEQSDILKSAYHGAAATKMHVLRDSLEDVLAHPSMMARQLGVAALSPRCHACDIHTICGGGLYAHRYDDTGGFTNPSVYCPDLYRLIAHIHHRVADDIAKLKGRRDGAPPAPDLR